MSNSVVNYHVIYFLSFDPEFWRDFSQFLGLRTQSLHNLGGLHQDLEQSHGFMPASEISMFCEMVSNNLHSIAPEQQQAKITSHGLWNYVIRRTLSPLYLRYMVPWSTNTGSENQLFLPKYSFCLVIWSCFNGLIAITWPQHDSTFLSTNCTNGQTPLLLWESCLSIFQPFKWNALKS